MDRTLSTALPPPPTAASQRRPWYHWRRLGLNFLTISILAHLLFGTAATYFVVQTITAKRKQTFAGLPSRPNPAMRAVEHKVQMQKKQQTMSAPAPVKRITTTSRSKVALPAMPATPPMDSAITPLAMAGMGGAGLGLGMGTSGGGGPSGGGGGGLSLFGFHGGGAGLEGTFYDYKMDQGYQPIKDMNPKAFARVVHDVLPTGGDWHPDNPYRHFTSTAKLHGRYFFFPAIQDTAAGAAFQSPRSGPGSWLAVYRGRFSAPAAGAFRFVGFGDNVMIVKIKDRIVLDASDHGYTGAPRQPLGNIKFPHKGATPLFAGSWFNLDAGESCEIEVAAGDEGGIFCSGLFIQPKEVEYAQGANGIPKLPLFMLGSPSDADRQLLGKTLPAECLQGPFFRGDTARVDASLLSH